MLLGEQRTAVVSNVADAPSRLCQPEIPSRPQRSAHSAMISSPASGRVSSPEDNNPPSTISDSSASAIRPQARSTVRNGEVRSAAWRTRRVAVTARHSAAARLAERLRSRRASACAIEVGPQTCPRTGARHRPPARAGSSTGAVRPRCGSTDRVAAASLVSSRRLDHRRCRSSRKDRAAPPLASSASRPRRHADHLVLRCHS